MNLKSLEPQKQAVKEAEYLQKDTAFIQSITASMCVFSYCKLFRA